MSVAVGILARVTAHLVSSLSEEEAQGLKRLVLNHQVKESWPWYASVLSRYLAGPGSQELVEEIDALFPDESVLKLIESNSDYPIFEAKIILREAQKLLQKSMEKPDL